MNNIILLKSEWHTRHLSTKYKDKDFRNVGKQKFQDERAMPKWEFTPNQLITYHCSFGINLLSNKSSMKEMMGTETNIEVNKNRQ